MSATMTPAQRRAELEQQIAQDARAEREAKLALFREAEARLQAAYVRRAELERELESGEFAVTEEQLCQEWNQLRRWTSSGMRPLSHSDLLSWDGVARVGTMPIRAAPPRCCGAKC